MLESDGHAVFLSPEGTAGAEVRIQELGESNAADLIQQRMDDLLARARTTSRRGDSEVFQVKPNRPPASAVTDQLWQAWQLEYIWHEFASECPRDVVDIIAPSNRHTHEVLITAWICVDDLNNQAEAERQKILSSFRGEPIK